MRTWMRCFHGGADKFLQRRRLCVAWFWEEADSAEEVFVVVGCSRELVAVASFGVLAVADTFLPFVGVVKSGSSQPQIWRIWWRHQCLFPFKQNSLDLAD